MIIQLLEILRDLSTHRTRKLSLATIILRLTGAGPSSGRVPHKRQLKLPVFLRLVVNGHVNLHDVTEGVVVVGVTPGQPLAFTDRGCWGRTAATSSMSLTSEDPRLPWTRSSYRVMNLACCRAPPPCPGAPSSPASTASPPPYMLKNICLFIQLIFKNQYVQVQER